MWQVLGSTAELTPGAKGIWTLVILVATGMVVTFLKTRPSMSKIKAESDSSLRADLMAHIARQDAKIDAQDALIAKEREECLRHIGALEAQIQVFRHERNNADQRFQALLMLLKRNPDDVPGAIALIEEMVARQEQAIATEKGAIAGNPNNVRGPR